MAFSQIEKTYYPIEELHFSLEQQPHHLAIKISGPLKNFQVIDDKSDYLLQKHVSMLPQGEHLISYRVQVESREGRAFWLEKTISSHHDAIDIFAKDLILEMDFKSDVPVSAICEGIIEVMLTIQDSIEPEGSK